MLWSGKVRGDFFSSLLVNSSDGHVERQAIDDDMRALRVIEADSRAIVTGTKSKTRAGLPHQDPEIAARIEQLRDVAGLHDAEIHAIDNAHRMLRLLEGEEERYAAEEKRRAIEEALHNLRSIAPKIQKLK